MTPQEVRLSDVLRELRQAHAVGKASDRHGWELLRMLCRPQKAGPRDLLNCRRWPERRAVGHSKEPF